MPSTPASNIPNTPSWPQPNAIGEKFGPVAAVPHSESSVPSARNLASDLRGAPFTALNAPPMNSKPSVPAAILKTLPATVGFHWSSSVPLGRNLTKFDCSPSLKLPPTSRAPSRSTANTCAKPISGGVHEASGCILSSSRIKLQKTLPSNQNSNCPATTYPSRHGTMLVEPSK